jgi:hypothetical protein
MTTLEQKVWAVAKEVYPVTQKEKTCINERGLRTIARGHLKKAIFDVINEKVNEQGSQTRTEEAKIQETPY